MTIGQKMKQIREDKGMTLAEVAFVANISRQRLSALENDKTGTPSIPIIQRIAKGLHCSVLDIIAEPLGEEDKVAVHRKDCSLPCEYAAECCFYEPVEKEKDHVGKN